jgi:hypothetical protein
MDDDDLFTNLGGSFNEAAEDPAMVESTGSVVQNDRDFILSGGSEFVISIGSQSENVEISSVRGMGDWQHMTQIDFAGPVNVKIDNSSGNSSSEVTLTIHDFYGEHEKTKSVGLKGLNISAENPGVVVHLPFEIIEEYKAEKFSIYFAPGVVTQIDDLFVNSISLSKGKLVFPNGLDARGMERIRVSVSPDIADILRQKGVAVETQEGGKDCFEVDIGGDPEGDLGLLREAIREALEVRTGRRAVEDSLSEFREMGQACRITSAEYRPQGISNAGASMMIPGCKP